MKSIIMNNEDHVLVVIRDEINEHAVDVLASLSTQINQKNIKIDCRDMVKINSHGSANWIRFINGLKAVSLDFYACSYEFMVYANMLKAFIGGGVIHSFFVPYYCEDCFIEKMVEIHVESIDENGEFAASSCDKCNEELLSDVDFDDFSGCLKKTV